MIRRKKSSEVSLAQGIGFGLGALLGLSVAAVGGWIAYSRRQINHAVELPDAIGAQRFAFNGPRAGQLSYYVDRSGSGRPLVLVHSVNAAASAYEMKPLFEAFRVQRPVFALDLPGFGMSDRSQRKYSPELYEGAVLDFLNEVVIEPADVVALSLGCEFAARAALSQPERFHSLALISPTGLENEPGGYSDRSDSESESSNLAYRFFTNPAWSRPLYDLLTTRGSIRYFLDRSFVGPVPEDLVEYDFASSHQPGAEHAPFYFVSGQLFTDGIRQAVYERLELPVLVIYDHDGFTGFRYLPELVENYPNWKARRIRPTLGLPHFEQPGETKAALQQFWKEIEEEPGDAQASADIEEGAAPGGG